MDFSRPDPDPSARRIERRRHRRYDLSVPVLVHIIIAEETFTPRRFPGRCIDISRGGACVKVHGIRKNLYQVLVRVPRMMQLSMSIPEAGGEVTFEGRLIHSEYQTSQGGRECLFGVAFRDLQESQNNALEGLLQWFRMKVLVVDNDEKSDLIIAGFFEAQGHHVVFSSGGSDVLECVRSEAPDMLLMGMVPPEIDGIEVCRQIKADPKLRDLYVLLMGQDEDGQDRRKALDAGADDFLRKPIDRAELLNQQTVAFDLAEYQRSLRAVALADPLTGLANRRSFDAAIRREAERVRLTSAPLALLVVDVDRFKEINDRYGHDKGDTVLRHVAQRIVSAVGNKDAAFRIGGDEFAILLPVSGDEARSIVQRLEGKSTRPDTERRLDVDRPGISVGLAMYNPFDSVEEFFARADANMYQKKRKKSSLGG